MTAVIITFLQGGSDVKYYKEQKSQLRAKVGKGRMVGLNKHRTFPQETSDHVPRKTKSQQRVILSICSVIKVRPPLSPDFLFCSRHNSHGLRLEDFVTWDR